MSDTWVEPGWWLASDGKWYPPVSPAEHADAVDTVLAHRVADEPIVLDLRAQEPRVEVVEAEGVPLTPPPIPRAATTQVLPVPAPPAARSRTSSSGGRWGGHRRVATPIGSTPTD